MSHLEDLAPGQVDDLVAEKVMGWRRLPECPQLHAPEVHKCPAGGAIPAYAADVKLAMQAAAAYAQKENLNFELTYRVEKNLYIARLCVSGGMTRSSGADVVPSLAICWALLRAVGVE